MCTPSMYMNRKILNKKTKHLFGHIILLYFFPIHQLKCDKKCRTLKYVMIRIVSLTMQLDYNHIGCFNNLNLESETRRRQIIQLQQETISSCKILNNISPTVSVGRCPCEQKIIHKHFIAIFV